MVADKVMRMPDPAVGNNFFFKLAISSIQRKCAHCEEEVNKAQRKETNNDVIAASTYTENYLNTLSGGRELSGVEPSFFEPRFGYDFSNVKIHTNSEAAKSAQSINALAYTTGKNIVFNERKFSPDTDSGKRLLGHELTHVVQQNSSIKRKIIQRTSFASQVQGDLNYVSPVAGVSDFPAAFQLLGTLSLTDLLDTFDDLPYSDLLLLTGNLGVASTSVAIIRTTLMAAYVLIYQSRPLPTTTAHMPRK